MKSDTEFVRGVWARIEQKRCLTRLAEVCAQRKKHQIRALRLCAGGICGLAAMLTPFVAAAQGMLIV